MEKDLKPAIVKLFNTKFCEWKQVIIADMPHIPECIIPELVVSTFSISAGKHEPAHIHTFHPLMLDIHQHTHSSTNTDRHIVLFFTS